MTKRCSDCGYTVPQALETVQGRVQCRSANKCVKRLAAKVQAMRVAGSLMANACYNLLQARYGLCESVKTTLTELYKAWDDAVRRRA